MKIHIFVSALLFGAHLLAGISYAHALDAIGIQALPAATTTKGFGAFVPKLLTSIFDQWKQWGEAQLPQASDIEKGTSVRSVVISTAGKVKMTDAKISAIGGDTFTVNVWGVPFLIKIDAATVFSLGRLGQWSFLEMQIGDHVDVLGTIDEATGTVLASGVNGKILQQKTQGPDLVKLQIKFEELMKKAQEFLAPARQAASSSIQTN